MLFLSKFQLPEPFSFIFTWFAAVPLIVWLAQSLTKLIVKDFLILKVTIFDKNHLRIILSRHMILELIALLIYNFTFKGPCPNCGTENLSFFGTILSISSGGTTNNLKCSE